MNQEWSAPYHFILGLLIFPILFMYIFEKWNQNKLNDSNELVSNDVLYLLSLSLQAEDAELVQHAADRPRALRHLLQRGLPHGDSEEVLRGRLQEHSRHLSMLILCGESDEKTREHAYTAWATLQFSNLKHCCHGVKCTGSMRFW